MPKSRGGSSTRSAPAKRGAPAPRPSQTNLPARSTAAPPAPAPKTAAPPAPTKAAATPAPAPQGAVGAPSSGGGFFSGVAQTALGVAGGHIIADQIMGAFGGGSKHEQAPAPAQQQQQPAQSPADRCGAHQAAFLKCMEDSSNNLNSCQWAFDFWNSCQKSATQEKWM